MTKRFNELGLSDQVLKAVKDMGYTAPTPVQEQAIPAVLAGHDVIAAAKTGTGKTAAFSLPSMDRLGHANHGQGPLMLVVTPTRELAMQIKEVCDQIAYRTHHHVACVVGGLSYKPQIAELKRGCDVLIATPGRLIDLMGQEAAKLGQVETLVLDEADRMLDMGFLPDMKRIVAACPANRQTLLFSATIDDAIEKNMKHLLNDPVFVEIAHKGETADTVDQYIVRVDQRKKNDLLLALLNEKGGTRIIVFARTRHRVDNTVRKLRRAGFKAEPIHSDRSQNQRKRALDAFADGKCDVLVATDVLSRGIDVPDVNYVVNLDLPTEPEDYVHRIGRTGRAGEHGFAVSFVSPETESNLHDIEKLTGKKIPTMEVKSFDPTESDAAIAAKATRKAAKNDPELAQAAKEYRSAEKAKARKKNDGHNGKPAPHKTRGTAKKQRKKNQKGRTGNNTAQQRTNGERKQHRNAKNTARTANAGDGFRHNDRGPASQGSSNGKGDVRPGRSQRARRSQQHAHETHRNRGHRR